MQQNIDFGTFPNDPNADAIRIAFQKIQTNIDELYSGTQAGPVLSINRPLTTIWPEGAGISVNQSSGNVIVTANISNVQFDSSQLLLTKSSGTVSASGVVLTQASQILNIELPNDLTISGNITTGGNVTVGGDLAVLGSFIQTSITTSGAVTALGTVTGGNLVTSGYLAVTGNANVGNLGTTGTLIAGGDIKTSGQLISTVPTGIAPIVVSSTTRVANLYVQGSNESNIQLTTSGINYMNFTTATSGNLAHQANSAFYVNVTSGTLYSPIIDASGNISSGGNITAVGNVTGGNLVTSGSLAVTGNANVGNLGTAGLIIAAGNISSGGNITAVGNVTGGNLVTGGYLAVTGNANVGNLGTAGLIIATGNITTSDQFISSVATGVEPLNVISTTRVANLYVQGANESNIQLTSAGINYLNFTTATSGNLPIQANAAFYIDASTSTLYSPIVNTQALTTGAAATAGVITGAWTLSAGSLLQSTYADLAEYYSADAKYEPGTVVEFGGENEVTIANSIASTAVAGVITTKPAYLMNTDINSEWPVAIALQGRVPVKVYGNVKRGDLLVSAADGHASSSNSEIKFGTVLGKAITEFTGAVGIVEIMVGRY